MMTTATVRNEAHRSRWLELAIVVAMVGLAVAWNLDATWIVGDELNAIHYLRSGFVDYMESFHYGPAIKAQFWTIHRLVGNDFGWYRVPSAVGAILACAFLFVARPALQPKWDLSVLAVAFLLVFNAAFLYFARWGMPSYAQGIAASTLLVGLALRDLQQSAGVRWSVGKLVLVALLPWLYPATIVLLGGISTYLGLALVPALFDRPRLRDLARRMFNAAVPLLLGIASVGLNLARRSTEDWERARAHHSTFTGWVAEHDGGWAAFVADGLAGLFTDAATPGVGIAPPASSLFAGGYTLVLLVVGLAMVAAPCLALWLRSRPEVRARVQAMLRGFGLLATIVLSTLLVTSIAALADAFPIGSIRYVFHLFPALAFLAILSLACVGWVVEHQAPRAWAAVVAIGTVAILVLSFVGVRALAEGRAAAEAREGALLSAMRSELTLAIVSWDPGFFLPGALFPDAEGFFHVGAGRKVPPGLVPLAFGARAPGTTGDARDLVFFSRSGRVLDRSGRLDASVSRFVERAGYEMSNRIDGGTYEVVVFSPAPGGGTTAERAIEADVALPPGPVRSVRIQPTELKGARVAISHVALVTGPAVTNVDLCADPGLQLVRTLRLRSTSDGCVFKFGNETGTGWIAPTALRNIPETGTPRRLRIAASGELGLQVKIFLDLGQGYSSKDMLAVDVPAPATPVAEDAPEN